ncbi:MAG: hypothetical protein RIQ53_2615 [Pseudomonadota bacterium]|jgi:hypothetical protein
MRALFITSDRVSSRLIRAADGGPASHCGILLPSGGVLDSTMTHRGVRVRSLLDFLADHRLVADIPLALPDPAAAFDWGLAQIGTPYDWTALAGIALWRDWQEEDAWYCSELLVRLCIAGGWTLASRPRRIGVHLALELCHGRREAFPSPVAGDLAIPIP